MVEVTVVQCKCIILGDRDTLIKAAMSSSLKSSIEVLRLLERLCLNYCLAGGS